MINQQVAKHLNDIAFFYKQEDKAFQAKAFEAAAEQIKALTEELTLDYKTNLGTKKLHKVGPSISNAIDQFLTKQTSDKYEQFLAEGKAPPSVSELTRIPGVGVKTAIKIYKQFGIPDLNTLNQKIELLKNTDYEKFIEPFKSVFNKPLRLPRGLVKSSTDRILEGLRVDWSYAGSMRRMKETIRDVDVIVVENEKLNKNDLRRYFESTFGLIPDVRDGDTKWGLSIPVADQLVVLDLNFCKPEEFGMYQAYLTGSSEHNIYCRQLCKNRGWLLNQKGLFDSNGNRLDNGKEEDLYRLLGVPYIPPECRAKGALGKDFSNLVTSSDIIIDLHSHSTNSDGGADWNTMVAQADAQGLKVLGITDHSQGSGAGPKPEDKFALTSSFRKLQKGFPIKVLWGAEVDVRADGTLDYDDDLIRSLDYVVFSLHHSYNKNVEERIIGALQRFKDVPKIWAHPTGRKIDLYDSREPARIDWGRIFKICKETNTLLEINSMPDRKDSPPEVIKAGIEAGVYFAINSDCHGVNFRRLLDIGTEVARQGWLTKDKCVSTDITLLHRWLSGELYI